MNTTGEFQTGERRKKKEDNFEHKKLPDRRKLLLENDTSTPGKSLWSLLQDDEEPSEAEANFIDVICQQAQTFFIEFGPNLFFLFKWPKL